MTSLSEELRIGHASVDFFLFSEFQWFDRLHAFENIESTGAWQGISNHLESITDQLSQNAREFILRAIRAEIDNAYQTTVLLKHFVLAIRVSIRVMKLVAKSDDDDDGDSDDEFRGGICGLCGDRLEIKEVGLKCKHGFHFNCYYKWREISHKCPACGPKVR